MARNGGRRASDYHGDDYEREGDVENRETTNRYGYDRRTKRTSLLSMLLALVLLLLIGGLIWWYFTQRDENNTTVQEETGEYQNEVRVQGLEKTLPEHRATLPTAPANIIIATESLNITSNSTIEIQKDNREFGEGSARVEANGRILRRDMDEGANDGIYTVNYKLCSQGQDCRSGSFQFKIDTKTGNDYQDRTNSRTVTIDLQNGRFTPEKVIVAQGTRVTWRNRDNTIYRLYPGTEEVKDYFPRLTSGPLRQNGSFTTVITEQGYIEYFAENGQNIVGKMIVR